MKLSNGTIVSATTTEIERANTTVNANSPNRTAKSPTRNANGKNTTTEVKVDEVIAALMHDAPEDQGGKETLEEVRKLFGDRVASIVDGCTDTYQNPKPPWRKRKEEYIESLETATQEVLRVSLADKLHNSRSLIKNLKQNGDGVWENFKGGKDGTLWYYQKLIHMFYRLFKL